jgi:hypothetical protein
VRFIQTDVFPDKSCLCVGRAIQPVHKRALYLRIIDQILVNATLLFLQHERCFDIIPVSSPSRIMVRPCSDDVKLVNEMPAINYAEVTVLSIFCFDAIDTCEMFVNWGRTLFFSNICSNLSVFAKIADFICREV